jgi:hypothetical protein
LHNSGIFNKRTDKEIVMQTKSLTPTRSMPSYPTRFALGLLVLTLTLILILTAVGPVFSHLLVDENCPDATVADAFSVETAVPNCWLLLD